MRWIILALVVAATTAPASARTSDVDEPNAIRIAYADLNLATDAGQKALRYRIEHAARTVCGFVDSRDTAVLWTATVACRRGAFERARPAYEAAVEHAGDHAGVALSSAFLIVTSR
jgi:UrcA family protein